MYDQKTGKLEQAAFAKVEEWLKAKTVAPCCTEAPGCGVSIYEYRVVTGILDMFFVQGLGPRAPTLGLPLVHVTCCHCKTVRLYEATYIFDQP